MNIFLFYNFSRNVVFGFPCATKRPVVDVEFFVAFFLAAFPIFCTVYFRHRRLLPSILLTRSCFSGVSWLAWCDTARHDHPSSENSALQNSKAKQKGAVKNYIFDPVLSQCKFGGCIVQATCCHPGRRQQLKIFPSPTGLNVKSTLTFKLVVTWRL